MHLRGAVVAIDRQMCARPYFAGDGLGKLDAGAYGYEVDILARPSYD